MSYNYINSILKKITGAISGSETVKKAETSGTYGVSKIKEAYYQTLEDELVELNETSETSYEEMLSSSKTTEDIQKEIEEKQQEIKDKQTETDAYIETCKNAIEAIFANGTDVIPKEVQKKYDEELKNIISNIALNTGTIQENLSIITENKISIEEAKEEIELKEKEIKEKEEEIETLQKSSNQDADKINELQKEIEKLNGEITKLNYLITNANKNIKTAENSNKELEADNSSLTDSQSGLMTNLMNEYYQTHTMEDRVYEDSTLKSQIENLESNIEQAEIQLTTNTLKLTNDIELLVQVKAIKEQSAKQNISSTTPTYSTGTTTYTGNLPSNSTLASAAEQTANSMGTTGWCLKGVNNTLEKVYGFRLSYNSAYQAIPALQSRSDFVEVTNQYENASELVNLPEGAIVVWENSSNHPHGHISIALGDGREASDHIQKQTTNYGTQYHVFIKNS